MYIFYPFTLFREILDTKNHLILAVTSNIYSRYNVKVQEQEKWHMLGARAEPCLKILIFPRSVGFSDTCKQKHVVLFENFAGSVSRCTTDGHFTRHGKLQRASNVLVEFVMVSVFGSKSNAQ